MNKKKILVILLLVGVVAAFTLAPVSAAKVKNYKVTITNKNVWGGGVISNTPSKKVTLYSGGKNGINYNPQKHDFKKSKYVRYKVSYTSHGTIYDQNLIYKAKIKYKKYDYKKGKYVNKYSYKTINKNIKGHYGGGNTISYTSNKNWVPVSATIYMKNIKH